MVIKYVFWDSDNTLLNTAEHHWRKHFETLQLLGIHLDDTWREAVYTNNGAQNWLWMKQELGLDLPQQDYLEQIDDWYIKKITEIEIRHGVEEALDFLKKKNIPQAVVSNGRRHSVMAALNGKNLTPYFEFVLCKEDYGERKPDPAPYLAALKKMNIYKQSDVKPEDCLVIEDDSKGVESGKAARMQVVARPIGDDFSLVSFMKNII